MKTISESLIEKLAGSAAYARGVDYYNSNAVGSININNGRILADVKGSQVYRVTLNHTNRLFEGSCNCPASDNFDFCKHCVAVALTYYYQTQRNSELTDLNETDRLSAYLETLSKTSLARELETLIRSNRLLTDQWLLKVDVATGEIKPAELKKKITRALPYKRNGLWGHSVVSSYFDCAEQALEAYLPIIETIETGKAFSLLEYAMQRLSHTLETIDDSGGYRYTTETLLAESFARIFQSCDWSMQKKGQFLAELIIQPSTDYELLNLPGDYLEALDETGKSAFFAPVQKVWETLTFPTKADDWDAKILCMKLQSVMIKKARFEQDFDQEIAIRTRTLDSVNDCLKLVELCLEHHRLDDAIEWQKKAEEYGKRDRWGGNRAVESQLNIWRYQKQFDKVLAVQWDQFASYCFSHSLTKVLETAQLTTSKIDYLDQGIKHLQFKLSNTDNQSDRARLRTRLVEIYLDHGNDESALVLAEQGAIEIDVLRRIATNYQHDIQRILPLVERLANYTVGETNNKAYKRTIALLVETEKHVDEKNQAAFEVMLKGLITTNKPKRNFVNWMQQRFSFL